MRIPLLVYFFLTLFLIENCFAQNRPGNGNPGPSTPQDENAISNLVSVLRSHLAKTWPSCIPDTKVPQDIIDQYEELQKIVNLKKPETKSTTQSDSTSIKTADCSDYQCEEDKGISQIKCFFVKNPDLQKTIDSLRKQKNYSSYIYTTTVGGKQLTISKLIDLLLNNKGQ